MKDSKGWMLVAASALLTAGGFLLSLGGMPNTLPNSMPTVPADPEVLVVRPIAAMEVQRSALCPETLRQVGAGGASDRAEPRDPEWTVAAPRLARELIDGAVFSGLAGSTEALVAWVDHTDLGATRVVQRGRADLAFVTGLPGQEPDRNGTVSLPVGDYIVAFLRHPSAGLDDLRTGQLQRLLDGRYENWRRLGGEDRPLVRAEQDFAQILSKVGLVPSDGAPLHSDPEWIRFVRSTDGAFAAIDLPTVLSLPRGVFAEPLLLAVDGVRPSAESFRRGHYGPGRRIWLVFRENAEVRIQELARQLTAPCNLATLGRSLLEPREP